MKLPSHLKIGGLLYELKVVDDLRDEDHRLLYGEVKHEECTIYIRKGTNPQVQATTLIHEALHALLIHAGIPEHSEHIVEALGNGVHQLLVDNPKLFTHIIGMKQE